MTSSPPGGGEDSTPSTLVAPELLSLPDAGPDSAGLRDVLAFGLDPAAAFGAAFALKRVVGNEKVNETLNRWAQRPEPGTAKPAAPAPGSANPASSPTPAATAAHPTAPAANTAAASPGAPTATAPTNPTTTAQPAQPSTAPTTADPLDAHRAAQIDTPARGATPQAPAAGREHLHPPTKGPEHPGGGTPDPAARTASPEAPGQRLAPTDGPDSIRPTQANPTSGAPSTQPTTAQSTHGPAGAAADAADAHRTPAGAPARAATDLPEGRAARPVTSAAAAADLDTGKGAAARTARPDPDAPRRAPARGAGTPRAGGAAAKGAAPRASLKAIQQGYADDSIKGAAKVAGKQVAGKGAAIGGRAAAATLLRLGAMSLPGLGTALTVLAWTIDTEGRKQFSKIWGSLFSGAVAAPDLNAAPAPPRTRYLPLTLDGGRDPLIDEMDAAMTDTMAKAFDFDPNDVWPTIDPPISTTVDLSATVAQFNELGTMLGEAIDGLLGAYQSGAAEPYIAQLWEKTKPSIDALRNIQETVLPAMGHQLTEGAVNANEAYQGFRAVNLKNRAAINNSSNGFLGWLIPGIHAKDMSDSTQEMRAAILGAQRIADQLAAAAADVSVTPNPIVAPPAASGESGSPGEPINPAPIAPTAPPAPLTPAPPTKPQETLRDLASMLANKVPPVPNPATMMPSLPNLGSMIPDPSAMPSPAAAEDQLASKGVTEDDVAQRLQELKDDRDAELRAKKEQASEVVPPQLTNPGPGAAPTPVTSPAPPAAQPPPAASNTAEIDGRKFLFDNPKNAAMAQKLFDGAGATSLYSAAADSGFQVPPPGQEIGQRIDIGDLKEGHVVLGTDDRGVFLGEVDGQPLVITEAGAVKPLADVAKFEGTDTGLFELADNGTPLPTLPDTGPSQAPNTSTNPGVIPGQQTGSTGLNPGVIPEQP